MTPASLAALLVFALGSLLPALPGRWADQTAARPERLGTVSFAVSCSAAVQPSFNRGVALLHDFWYMEARRQFEDISKTEPDCGMAYWGLAMSRWHQIWDRPSDETLEQGWKDLQKAAAPGGKTERERSYVAALSAFYKPGAKNYQARVSAYADKMKQLHEHQPEDVDASAFYGLALLASEAPDDTSLSHERQALALLSPLFEKNPEHPGLAHYIIHACDSPPLAKEGLAAAQRYGEIAPSAAHAAHMPAHIFARLGMWQEDIHSNLDSVAATQAAAATGRGGPFDQLHADDFLVYAYIQSGQDIRARELLDKTLPMLDEHGSMGGMGGDGMAGMLPYYQAELPGIYRLEMGDWKAAETLAGPADAKPGTLLMIYWTHAIAAGHLRDAAAARANVKNVDAALEQIRKGKHPEFADSTGYRLIRTEAVAWTAFAEGDRDGALKGMREAADLQDKTGQGEVDIPAREMLADMLLELRDPQAALVEYDLSLSMSPNRLNGLYHAGQAAEAAGDKARAQTYYAQLMKVTNGGSQSARPEFARVKTFLSAMQVAEK